MENFEPTLDELRKQNLIFYEVVAGSVAYGLNTKDSDEDLRGYYHVPIMYRDGLGKVADQANDEKHDITFYNLKRAFNLLMTANPNQIELLWIPEDCIRTYNKAIMDDLLENRNLFISKASYVSHFQYAKAQIHKATGQNKWVNNPKLKEPPKKEDFCWYIDVANVGYTLSNALMKRMSSKKSLYHFCPNDRMPFRPETIKNSPIDLSLYNCAKMEHMENTYRLYFYGDKAKGVFRGKNEMLTCESIPKDDEWTHFSGLLICNEQAWKNSLRDWSEYWKWMKNRNEKRWVDQEKGKLDFDSKNLSHCVRLMLSSKHILTEGYPIVRFEGETKDLLMKIKNGDLEYVEIMEMVNKLQKELDVLFEKTNIPEQVNFDLLNKLYVHLNNVAEKELVNY